MTCSPVRHVWRDNLFAYYVIYTPSIEQCDCCNHGIIVYNIAQMLPKLYYKRSKLSPMGRGGLMTGRLSTITLCVPRVKLVT